jgi:hypothetical protein
MNPKMRCHLPGTFMTRDLRDGAWRLSRGEPQPIDVILRGAESGAAEVFRVLKVSDIDIEWGAEAALLTLTTAERRRSIKTQSAIVHQPLPRLYEALPLVSFDDKARRFWRRVFRLVRIPGGRYLLGVLARRNRDRQ